MFSIEFLNEVRNYEIGKLVKRFPTGARVLEIGGGTGYQARLLAAHGFAVTSIDIASSNYRSEQVYPVQMYDGNTFPFDQHTFDLVFSSNVLEHVKDLDQLHREVRRVLKPNGFCVHVMPTAVWRFWSSVTHYVELIQRLGLLLPSLIPESLSPREALRPIKVAKNAWDILSHYAVPPRHGEVGNVVSELWTFSPRHWVRHFDAQQFEILCWEPLGLFYTGQMVLGSRWSTSSREWAASLLGSACYLYQVKPKNL